MQQNKSILTCRHIAKSFNEFAALKDITFNLQSGDKVGLVGPNGVGKSTILKIISGIIEPDTGLIERAKDIQVGYIPQHFSEYEHESTLQFLIESTKQPENDVKIKAVPIMHKLNLPAYIFEKQMGQLSGGEKTKVGLLRILISDYNLFLLDEPTNNLDIDALNLLETFVGESKKTFIIVSHDRAFLDNTVNRIIGIDEYTKVASIYEGNFSDYVSQKEKEIERSWDSYTTEIEKREKIERAIELKEDKTSRSVKRPPPDTDKMGSNFVSEKAMRKDQRGARLMKEKLEGMGELEKPITQRPLRIDFSFVERSGDKVLELAEVTKKMGNKTIGPISLHVRYGDRILILGKNGTEKSTIIRTIMGELQPDSGEVHLGTNLSLGYLPQDELHESITVLDFLRNESGIEESQLRKTLNRFRITADDLQKKMSEISSGEKSRFLIALMMVKKANCIILDEPSNHLDLEVLTQLESALKKYKGSLIVVSHDRYLVRKVRFNKYFVLDSGLRQLANYQEYEGGV